MPAETLSTERESVRPTADLLRVVSTAADSLDLAALGVAIHHFADLARFRVDLDVAEIHRAVTVLTKQVRALLEQASPLASIRTLVTDPDRTALPDGRTAAVLCGAAWPEIQQLAGERAEAALAGAVDFGETAILRLAASRAVVPTTAWWGTPAWAAAVQSRVPLGSLDEATLLTSPERADPELLRAVLAASAA